MDKETVVVVVVVVVFFLGGGGLHWQHTNIAQIIIFYIKIQSGYEANMLLEIHSVLIVHVVNTISAG